MADGDGSKQDRRATRVPHAVRVGTVELVVPVGTALNELLFDASMFLAEAMAATEGMIGHSTSELCIRADALGGLQHLMGFSREMIEAVSKEVARG